MSDKSMPQDSYRFATCSTHPLTASWWKDRKDVYVMSALHKKAIEYVMKRPKGCKEKKSIPCPSMIADGGSRFDGPALKLLFYDHSKKLEVVEKGLLEADRYYDHQCMDLV